METFFYLTLKIILGSVDSVNTNFVIMKTFIIAVFLFLPLAVTELVIPFSCDGISDTISCDGISDTISCDGISDTI